MKCEKCVELNQVSKLYVPLGGYTTCMAHQAYYDEKGKYHSHDPNVHWRQWSCSKGHSWVTSEKFTCKNCDYGKNSRTVTWL